MKQIVNSQIATQIDKVDFLRSEPIITIITEQWVEIKEGKERMECIFKNCSAESLELFIYPEHATKLKGKSKGIKIF